MDKRDFLKEKYEEINRLKISIQDYPKEYIDSILKSISKVCDEITEHLEKAGEDSSSINNKEDNEVKDCCINELEKDFTCKHKQKGKSGRIFTIDELSKFNGKDGKPPYAAIDGVVYDLSGISKWKNGRHYGLIAGQVLTEEYYKCHSEESDIIKRARAVGYLEEKRNEEKVFTREELSRYDGRGGMPAYAAVNGVVYDMAGILQWKGGMHYGLMAGQDLTPYFEGCHSENPDILKNACKVGFLKETREGESVYSTEQLSKFDGRNGAPAYVAVNGIVYDVTDMKQWRNGKHYGLMAGKDLSEFFNSCHKGEEKILLRLKEVGRLESS